MSLCPLLKPARSDRLNEDLAYSSLCDAKRIPSCMDLRDVILQQAEAAREASRAGLLELANSAVPRGKMSTPAPVDLNTVRKGL